MSRITDLKVKIFADGADYDGMVKMSRNPAIKGFTTNPTLMRKAGVSDYEAFARKVLATITDRPVSFEVFADDFASMAEQARTISTWGSNVNVKIPVTNTKGQSSNELIRVLSSEGVMLNVTANSRNSRPTIPAIIKIGMKTAISDTLMERTVNPISAEPLSVAIIGERPASRYRVMFSITTMASSTTNPVAIVTAISDKLSTE